MTRPFAATIRTAKKGIPMHSRALLVCLACLVGFSEARADKFKFDFTGYVASDLRFVIDKQIVTKGDGLVFYRNDNIIRLRLEGKYGSVIGVADVRLFFTGFSRSTTIEGLAQREKLDPFHIELDAAYIAINDFIIKDLELTFGRKVITWGAADIFNPTDNLVPDDLADPIKFGENIANNLVQLKYSPKPYFNLALVFVPVFRAAQLPPWAKLGFQDPKLINIKEAEVRKAIDDLLVLQSTVFKDAAVNYTTQVNLPTTKANNGMMGVKISSTIGDFDLSLSYFIGRDDLPLATEVTATLKNENGVNSIDTHVKLEFPRMQVIGFDIEADLSFLWNIGFRAELAWFFPQRMPIKFTFPFVGVKEGTQVSGHAFWKLTVGLDYTFTKWLYVQVMALRGFIDEFGHGNQHWYIVAGTDFKFWSDKILLRIFTVVDVERGSAILYPELKIKAWTATELILGALLYLGKHDSKFGHPVSGPGQVFMRAKVQF